MNAPTAAERQTQHLVDIVDLKWLLAHEGIRLHVERLLTDPAYALPMLQRAAASTNAPLRRVALRLLATFDPGAP